MASLVYHLVQPRLHRERLTQRKERKEREREGKRERERHSFTWSLDRSEICTTMVYLF